MRRRTLRRTAPAAIVGGPGHGGTTRAADPGPATAAVHLEKAGGTTLPGPPRRRVPAARMTAGPRGRAGNVKARPPLLVYLEVPA